LDKYLDRLRRRYIKRINQALSFDLVKINLEIALDFIENNDLHRARRAICQLAEALDFKYGLSQHLFSIYSIIEKKLTAGIVNNELPAVSDAKYLIHLLLDKWRETDELTKKTETKHDRNNVYVGLTYNASGLCEYADQDYSDGYKA